MTAVIGTFTYIHKLETPLNVNNGHSAQRVLQQAESAVCPNCSNNVVDSAAGEITSPEEAVPEEMAPDQEPPAIPTPAKPAVLPQHVDVKENAIDVKMAAPSNSPVNVIKPGDKKTLKPDISKAKVVVDYENPSVPTHTLYRAGHKMPPKDICPNGGAGMKLLILVTTAPSHGKQREAVRGTWGHVAFRRDVGFAFMVGISANAKDNQAVEAENQIYGDVIQGNFIDSYNNLTLKTISMLEWSRDHCSRVKYLLKTDDDMYIHMPVLFKILDRSVHKKRTIMGKVGQKWKPIRNKTSKYYISPAQFRPPLYPDFNTGPAYVLTNDVFDSLYKASLAGTFFKLEDVYVTGMIAARLKIQHVDFPEFYNRRLKLDTCAVNKLASVHMVKTFEMYDLWKRLSDGLTTCVK